jgi:hypothetical protein
MRGHTEGGETQGGDQNNYWHPAMAEGDEALGQAKGGETRGGSECTPPITVAAAAVSPPPRSRASSASFRAPLAVYSACSQQASSQQACSQQACSQQTGRHSAPASTPHALPPRSSSGATPERSTSPTPSPTPSPSRAPFRSRSHNTNTCGTHPCEVGGGSIGAILSDHLSFSCGGGGANASMSNEPVLSQGGGGSGPSSEDAAAPIVHAHQACAQV